MNKKIFAWIMALAMVLTMMPMPGVHNHAHAEADHVHDWTYGQNYCICTCNARCKEFTTDVDVQSSMTTLSNMVFRIYENRPCGVDGHDKQTPNVPALKTERPATCKEPAKTVYTAEGYPEVVWTVTNGNQLADHDWAYEDGKCTVCGEIHNHTYGCGNVYGKICDTCGVMGLGIIHPDNFPADGLCDFCEECLDQNLVQKYDDEQHWYECTAHNGEHKDYFADHVIENGACTKCDYKCSHNYAYEHIEGTEGYKAKHQYICSLCGNVPFAAALCYNSDSDGDGICNTCKFEYEHKNCRGGEATCTKQAVCEICGEPYGEALGHGKMKYVHIEKTEGVASVHDGACSVCGEVVFPAWPCADDNKDHLCDKCDFALSEHNFVAESDNNGKHTMKCDFCGLTGTTSFCEDYTGDGLCDKCGYELPKPEPHEHDYVSPKSNDDGTHTLSCNCGEEFTMNCGDYNGDRFCDSCGYEMLPPAPPHEHNYVTYSNNDGTHTLECNCGIAFDPMKCMDYSGDGLCDSCDYEMYHAGGTPTCTEQAICQNCGQSYGKTLPHDWVVNADKCEFDLEDLNFVPFIECATCETPWSGNGMIKDQWEIVEGSVVEATYDTEETTDFFCEGTIIIGGKAINYSLEKNDVVTAPALSYIVGDINMDGAVNGLDEVRLMKYLAGQSVEINLKAADVNGDGEVNGLDDVRLMKILAAM